MQSTKASEAYPHPQMLTYRRHAYPWRELASAAASNHSAVYSKCWAPSPTPTAASSRPWLLAAVRPAAITTGARVELATRWQAAAVALGSNNTIAPIGRGMNVILALARVFRPVARRVRGGDRKGWMRGGKHEVAQTVAVAHPL